MLILKLTITNRECNMYTIIENKDKKLVAQGKHGNEAIHIIHCSDTLEELRGDVATPYIVAEEFSSYARVHLVTDFSEDGALNQVADYIIAEGCPMEDIHMIGVFEATTLTNNKEVTV